MTAAETAVTTANDSATALIAERDTAGTGQQALADATAATLATATTDYDTAVSEFNTSNGTYQPARLAYDKAVMKCSLIDTGCTGVKSEGGNVAGLAN